MSIIPLPTAIASAYARHGSQASAAVVLYGTVMMLMGLSFSFSWRYLAGHPELVAEPARGAFPAGTWRALLGGLAYLPAIVIGLFLPIVSFGIDAAIAAYFAASKSEVPGPYPPGRGGDDGCRVGLRTEEGNERARAVSTWRSLLGGDAAARSERRRS